MNHQHRKESLDFEDRRRKHNYKREKEECNADITQRQKISTAITKKHNFLTVFLLEDPFFWQWPPVLLFFSEMFELVIFLFFDVCEKNNRSGIKTPSEMHPSFFVEHTLKKTKTKAQSSWKVKDLMYWLTR